MEEVIKKRPRAKRFDFSAETMKGFLTVSLSVICLLCFCFCDLFSKNQLDVGISVSFSGIDLFRLAFLGGEYVEQYWMDDGKGNGFFMDLTVTYPSFVCWLAIVGILLLAALIVFQTLRYTKYKGNQRVSKYVAYANFAVSALFLIAYVSNNSSRACPKRSKRRR